MARKSVGSFILTALISTPLCSFAAQYPLTVTDLDGRAMLRFARTGRVGDDDE